MLFKLNYRYYLQMFVKKDVNFCFKSKSANKLSAKLKKLINVCKTYYYYIQELQKQIYK